MDDVSAAEPVREVDDHHAQQLLRAWLRGDQHPKAVDLEALDHPDTAELAATLRECAADGCLDVDVVRGVADLVMHAAVVHDFERLGDGTVRAFGLLAAGVHGRNATPEEVCNPAKCPVMIGFKGSMIDDFVRGYTATGAVLPRTPEQILEVSCSRVKELIRGVLFSARRPLGLDQVTDAKVTVRAAVALLTGQCWGVPDALIQRMLPEVADDRRVFELRDGRLVHGEYCFPDGWCMPEKWVGR